MSNASTPTTTKAAVEPLRWLPSTVAAVLLAVGVLLVPVSASGLGGGPFRIDAGGVTGEAFTITRDDLTCRTAGSPTTCTAQVGGQPLTVVLTDVGLSCMARQGDRSVGCERHLVVGPGSRLLRISDQLGVDATEAAAWRARASWWRTWTENDWTRAGLLLVAGLVSVAGAAGWLLSGRQLPALPRRRRVQLTWTTGLLGWLLPAATSALLRRSTEVAEIGIVLLIPHSVLVPAMLLAVWQWVIGGSITGRPAQRLMMTGVGVAITLVYSVPMTLWLLLEAGFVD